MSETIYISRKCEHCHELLILLHQNRDVLKFPVVDVHKSPYPKIVTSVPCMVIGEKVLPGEELFKFINYLISQNNEEVVKNNELMPNENPKQLNKPIQNAGQGPMANAGPMHNGNPMQVNQPSQQKNLNIPGNMQNDMVKQNEPKPNIDDDELLPGFCVGGVCELGFSSLENENDITMDNTFEILDSSGDIEPRMDEGNTKSEKAKQVDDDYSRMMQERGNDLSAKVN
tara:strand:+ start:843 stop:1526 length:684 start_codon:yes stop_codon:yes gene_type:complete